MIAVAATRGFVRIPSLVGVVTIGASSLVASSPSIGGPTFTRTLYGLNSASIAVVSPSIGIPIINSSGPANFTVTDHSKNSTVSGGTTSINPVSNIPAGSLIVVQVNEATSQGGSPGTLSDSAGNVYVLANHKSPNNVATNGCASVWYVLSCKALTALQTITYSKHSNGVAAVICAMSATYIGTLSLDQNVTPTSGSGTSPSIISGVPANAGELWFGLLGIDNRVATDTFTQPTGWTVGPDSISSSGSTTGQGGGYIVSTDSAAKVYNPIISSRAWAAFLISFQAA
jgi:hypothetical protein